MKNAIIAADSILARLTAVIAVSLFLLIPILTSYQVLARFVLNDPASWTEAAVRLAMIWSAFLGLSLLIRSGLMISMDFVTRRAAGTTQSVLTLIEILAAVIVFGAAIYGGVKLVSVIKAQRVAGLGISMGFAYAAVPVGSALALLTVATTALSRLAGGHRPDAAGEDAETLTLTQT